MDKKVENTEELIDTLIAISVIAKRLACKLRESQEVEKDARLPPLFKNPASPN